MYYHEDVPIILDGNKLTTYDIDNICSMLEQGRIIVFPTETVYGLACNALNMESVKKIYNIKRRDYSKPLLIHIGKTGDVYQYIEKVEPEIKRLIEKYWPGPLSMVLDKSENVPDYVTNGSKKVGIRCTSNKIAQAILNNCNFPVVATSANLSGYENCFDIQQIAAQLKTNVDLYVDGGKLENNIASTVVEIENGQLKVLREGIIKEEEIKKIINCHSERSEES